VNYRVYLSILTFWHCSLAKTTTD